MTGAGNSFITAIVTFCHLVIFNIVFYSLLHTEYNSNHMKMLKHSPLLLIAHLPKYPEMLLEFYNLYINSTKKTH